MLAQNDLERERYEARRKAQLDFNTGMKVARMEGREEGRVEIMINMIHLCEQLLQQPQSPAVQLTALPLIDLTRLADDLQAQVLQQREQRSENMGS